MQEDVVVSVNPATLQENGRVPVASPEDVKAAVAAARAAQPAWAARGLKARAHVLRTFQALLLEEKDAIAERVTRETGKPLPEAMAADVLPALEAVTWLTRHGTRILSGRRFRNHILIAKDRTSRVRYEPKGVVGIIGPWNYPLGIPASQVLFALYAGNAVVFKPSEFTTLTGLALRDLLLQSGVPEDVLHVVPGHGVPTGAALAEADVDHLVFTGSVETGRKVEAACRARGITPCLELGGSDPALVLDDADVDVAANGIAWGRFSNAGQTCVAPKRVFVHEAVADAFIERLVGIVQRLRVGYPLHGEVDVGPVINADAVARMEAFVDDAFERGATVRTGGRPLDDLKGHFFAPTVLTDVPEDARVLHEETFGPVLPIVRVKDDDEAVRRANATRFGLAASVWSRDRARALRVAERLEAGTVVVNDVLYNYALMETPWLGTKDSGRGATHGEWGLLELVEPRHVNIAPAGRPLKPMWWFPYGADAPDAWRHGLGFLYGRGSEKLRHAWGATKALVGKRNL